MAHIMNLMNHK